MIFLRGFGVPKRLEYEGEPDAGGRQQDQYGRKPEQVGIEDGCCDLVQFFDGHGVFFDFNVNTTNI
jgi:hypothetical protein